MATDFILGFSRDDPETYQRISTMYHLTDEGDLSSHICYSQLEQPLSYCHRRCGCCLCHPSNISRDKIEEPAISPVIMTSPTPTSFSPDLTGLILMTLNSHKDTLRMLKTNLLSRRTA